MAGRAIASGAAQGLFHRCATPQRLLLRSEDGEMNPTGPLEDWELDELDRFLLERLPQTVDSEERDEGLLGMSELDGFFTAIISGPALITPAEWLPAVWGESEPDWDSAEGFEKIYQLMIRHYNDVVNSLMAPGFEFEPVFNENEVDGESFVVVDEWCLGYMRGVALAADAWDKGGEELIDMLRPIMLFSDEPGLELLKSMDEEMISDLQASIPGVAQDIQRFWLARRRFPSLGGVAGEPAIDPDAPCPCGSGKSFRKCCLH
jgi:uncharacterized protein